MDVLLDHSATARSDVGIAVGRLQACQAGAREAAGLRRGVTVRRDLQSQLSSIAFDELPEGAALSSLLDSLWEESAQADKDYLRAYQAVRSSCTTAALSANEDYRSATRHSEKASKLKDSFVVQWGPIADLYGLAPRTGVQI